MKEVPVELPSKTSEPAPADSVLDAIDRSTALDRAYAKARESELNLVEALATENETDFLQIHTDIIRELNSHHGYIDEILVINGLIRFNGIDPSKGFNENNEATIKEFEVEAADASVKSLGFVSVMAANGHEQSIEIRHKALMGPEPILSTEVAIMYQSGNLYLPIDGSVDVQLKDEQMPPHFELLSTYIPELVPQIDAALFDDSLPTKQLRALSKINFASNPLVSDRGGFELKEEIANYINNYLDLTVHGICYVAGSKDIILPTPDSYSIATLEKFRAVGVPHGVEFSPIDDRLVLKMSVPFHGSGMQEMLYVLNPRITITPVPQLMQAPSRHK